MRIWDTATGKPQRTITEFAGEWRQAFAPGGKAFAEVRGSAVVLWNTDRGELIRVLKRPRGDAAPIARLWQWIAYAPDGARVGAVDGSGRIIIWRADSGDIEYACKTDGPINSIAFSADGDQLVVGDSKGQLTVWKLGEPDR